MSNDTCVIIKLDPVMDLDEATELEEKFEELAFTEEKYIYLDFSEVEFLCCYTMRVLVKFHDIFLRAGIEIGIRYISEYSKDFLETAGLCDLFTLTPEWFEECDFSKKETLSRHDN